MRIAKLLLVLCPVFACGPDGDGDESTDRLWLRKSCAWTPDPRSWDVYRDEAHVRLSVSLDDARYETLGTLTAAALERVTMIEKTFSPSTSDSCASADGCDESVLLSDGDLVYCTTPVPDDYAELHAFSNEVMLSLSSCQDSAHVRVEADCQPVPISLE